MVGGGDGWWRVVTMSFSFSVRSLASCLILSIEPWSGAMALEGVRN